MADATDFAPAKKKFSDEAEKRRKKLTPGSLMKAIDGSSKLVIFGLNSRFWCFRANVGVSGPNGPHRKVRLIETSRLTLSTSNSGNFEIFAIFRAGFDWLLTLTSLTSFDLSFLSVLGGF